MALAREEEETVEVAIPTLTLGDRLMLARKKAGISREEMAELLGVTPGAVGHWESDLRQPKDLLGTVQKWGKFTHTPWPWLIGAEATARKLDAAGEDAYMCSLPAPNLSRPVPNTLSFPPGLSSLPSHTTDPEPSAAASSRGGRREGLGVHSVAT